MLRRSFQAFSSPPPIRGSALALAAAVLATAGSLFLPPRAQALLLYTLRQTGPSTITITGGGTATRAGLNQVGSDFNTAELRPASALLGTGPTTPLNAPDDMVRYTGVSGPTSFGTSSAPATGGSTSAQINAVSLWGAPDDGDPLTTEVPYIYFSKDFNESQTIASKTTFEGVSLASLGLTPNTSFEWTWGTGSDQILRLEIEPVPGPLPALGAAAAFGWSRRLRRLVRAGEGIGTGLKRS